MLNDRLIIRSILTLLRKRGSLFVPGWGLLELRKRPSRKLGRRLIQPPRERIDILRESPRDDSLIKFLSRRYNHPRFLVERAVRRFTASNNLDEIEIIPGMGIVRKNFHRHILYPEAQDRFFGLPAIPAEVKRRPHPGLIVFLIFFGFACSGAIVTYEYWKTQPPEVRTVSLEDDSYNKSPFQRGLMDRETTTKGMASDSLRKLIVICGSFPNFEDGNDLRERLARLGYTVYRGEADGRYRVGIHLEVNADQVASILSQIREDIHPKAWILDTE